MTEFSRLQKSFCLGFAKSSLILLLFAQALAFVGTSVYISSSLLAAIFIGIILGFTSFYFFSKLIKAQQKKAYLITAAMIAVFASTLFMLFLWSHLNNAVAFVIYLFLPGVLVFAFLGLLFAQNLLCLQQNLLKNLISFALGIVVGALLTELILLNFLGIAWAVVLNSCLILWCVVFDIKSFSQELVASSAVIAIVVVAFGFNVQLNNSDALHQDYRAISQEHYQPVAPTEFLSQSLFMNAPIEAQKEYPYITLLRKVLYHDLDIKNQDILILGNGGYQLTRQDTKNLHFTYLNYSANGRPSACTFLDVMASGNNIVTTTEKKAWHSDKLYNVIVSNIFPNNVTIPPALLSYQQVSKVRDALPKNGIAIFNVVARPTLTDLYSKRVDNTIRSVFPSCMEIPLVYSDKPTNIIYVCRKSKEERDNAVYTTNLNAAHLQPIAI